MKKSVTLIVIISFIYTAKSQTQLDNSGFEYWEDAGTTIDEPVDWSSIKTSDDPTLNGFAPQVWGQSSDAHSGSYSLELTNVSTFGIVANGTVTNGRVHADFNPSLGYVFTESTDDQWYQTFTDHPDSLVGWVKYTPNGNDKGKLHAILHTSNAQIPENGTLSNWVSEAKIEFTTANSSWARFSAPFNYFNSNTPEYILLVLTSGDSTVAVDGSKALVDDLELIYNPVSIKEEETYLRVWSSGNTLFTEIGVAVEYAQLNLYSISGQFISSRSLNTFANNQFYLDLPSGIYLAELKTNYNQQTIKLFIN